MAVQSFNLSVDFLNNLEKPIIYIAKKDKTFLGAVSIYDDLSLYVRIHEPRSVRSYYANCEQNWFRRY